MLLKVGLRGFLSHTVCKDNLATKWRNDVPVFATPLLLWFGELACMRAIDGAIGEGKMSLGYGHDVKHLAPTPEGWTISFEAVLTMIEGKLLTFEVQARDGQEQVLSGRHVRAIVDREKFVARVAAKAATRSKVLSEGDGV